MHPTTSRLCPLSRNSGRHLLTLRFSESDPKLPFTATLAEGGHSLTRRSAITRFARLNKMLTRFDVNTAVPNNSAQAPNQIQEVWFAGVHSDVGGGYADDELARIPLVWMLEEANSATYAILVRDGCYSARDRQTFQHNRLRAVLSPRDLCGAPQSVDHWCGNQWTRNGDEM